MSKLKMPLSNVQLELLKLFATNVPEKDLEVIQKILIRYQAERLMDSADEMWVKRKWDETYIQEMLKSHLRTPYKRNSGS